MELVSGLNSEVEGVLGGLRRALPTQSGEGPVRTGLVPRPPSSCLVLNSSPGFLQFYDAATGVLSQEAREPVPHSCHLMSLSVCLLSWMWWS